MFKVGRSWFCCLPLESEMLYGWWSKVQAQRDVGVWRNLGHTSRAEMYNGGRQNLWHCTWVRTENKHCLQGVLTFMLPAAVQRHRFRMGFYSFLTDFGLC